MYKGKYRTVGKKPAAISLKTVQRYKEKLKVES